MQRGLLWCPGLLLAALAGVPGRFPPIPACWLWGCNRHTASGRRWPELGAARATINPMVSVHAKTARVQAGGQRIQHL